MDIRETYDLALWFVNAEKSANYVSLLDEIIKRISNTSGVRNSDILIECRYILTETGGSISTSSLTKAQLNALSRLHIDEIICKRAANYYDNVFYSTHSVHTVLQMLNVVRRSLIEAKQSCISMTQCLPILLSTEGEPRLIESIPQENEAALRLTFQREASISDIAKLNQWSKRLFNIGRGFALVTNHKPEDIRVIGAGNGSIFFDIVANLETINLMTDVIGNLVDVSVRLAEGYAAYLGIKNSGKIL